MLSSDGLYPDRLPKTCTPIWCSLISSIFPFRARSETYSKKLESRVDRAKLELAAIRRASCQRLSPTRCGFSHCRSCCNSEATTVVLWDVSRSTDQGGC